MIKQGTGAIHTHTPNHLNTISFSGSDAAETPPESVAVALLWCVVDDLGLVDAEDWRGRGTAAIV